MVEEAVEDLTMTTEIYGVLTLHEWIGEASVRYDLDEDLFSLAVKRAAAYGWSSTFLPADRPLGGQRWDHADAGGDWSQDGRTRQLAWLLGYPAVDLQGQRLPIRPMTRVLMDSLERVSSVSFHGLRTRVPVSLSPDIGFDLSADADWFSLARLGSTVHITAVVTCEAELNAAELSGLANDRGYGRFTARVAPPGAVSSDGEITMSPTGVVRPKASTILMGVAPEWTPDSAAWVTEILVDSLRSSGIRESVEIAVSLSRS